MHELCVALKFLLKFIKETSKYRLEIYALQKLLELVILKPKFRNLF